MRRTLALSILWAFAGNFCSSVKIPVKRNFQASKLVRTWYPIAVATNHEGQDHLMAVGRFVKFKPPRDLLVEFAYIGEEECYATYVDFRHHRRLGQFITEGEKPELTGYNVHILETDYTKYNIFHMERDGKAALVLDGREPTVPERIRQRFKYLAKALGISANKIVEITDNDYCYLDHIFWDSTSKI